MWKGGKVVYCVKNVKGFRNRWLKSGKERYGNVTGVSYITLCIAG